MEGLYKKGIEGKGCIKNDDNCDGLFFLLYFCQSMPRRQAGSLVPCAL